MLSTQPAHVRIAEHWRKAIRLGILKPGDRLPSMSQQQKLFDCSYGPVREAACVLRHEGLTVGEVGVGVYVSNTDGAQ